MDRGRCRIDGRLITLEYEAKHAKVAEENIKNAGMANKIDIIVGTALKTLQALKEKGLSSFDLIFIDADKPNNPEYLIWALELSRPGTVILESFTEHEMKNRRLHTIVYSSLNTVNKTP
ncbi:Putative O-methyltransferase MSMEG_5073/MSMEI_4947 [Peribacillus sp. Bi96]|uniref:O-methyltransferase n=1 Tax=Peribacillus sp. NPDC060253 TaxID=3347084 RepID=UPI001D6CD829|nr:Putative O-methyltransferase MSMEG_5073/MSMEI_4947 [Peribacillus sp. Bi96]